MTRTALDTGVVVAALMSWHDAHPRAHHAVQSCRRAELVLPRTTPVQTFSVMTRLPSGYGVTAERAREMLRNTFAGRGAAVVQDPPEPWDLVDRAVRAGARGGGIHDFKILECAVAAKAKRLLTLDAADFRRFGDRGVEIVEP